MRNRAVNLESTLRGSYASFSTKPEAVAFAKSYGWSSGDVMRAANRFQVFWVIGQIIEPDFDTGHTYKLVNLNGGVCHVKAKANSISI